MLESNVELSFLDDSVGMQEDVEGDAYQIGMNTVEEGKGQSEPRMVPMSLGKRGRG